MEVTERDDANIRHIQSHKDSLNGSDVSVSTRREFVAARPRLEELSALADLEKVSVLTYNVLSQMGARRLQRADMGYVDGAILTIMRRREVLFKEILGYVADIMCLQEVDDYDDYWSERLTATGYDSVFAAHKSKQREDGLLIAFRKEVFQLFGTHEIDLNGVIDNVTDENLQAKCRQNRLALLVNLQPWEQSRLPSAICVVTTQLTAGPTLEQVRVLQAEYLCREIARINASFHLPTVLAGTFNALPSSDVYHVIQTGRRRPSPEAPREMKRPVPQDASPSSVQLAWTPPECGDAPILGYKIGIKNCTSATLGFDMHEIEFDGDANTTEYTVTMLSAGIPYQFRMAARNLHGYGHFSQPSAPVTTPLPPKVTAASDANDLAVIDVPTFFVDETPPQVKPYSPSFGSGYTPRLESGEKQLETSPRKLLQHTYPAEAKRFETLAPRADRDEELVHNSQFESAYATYHGYLSEPEFTYVSERFTGTVDYIFYSATQFAPFQLLALPTLETLEALGDDTRQQGQVEDMEWAKYKPVDWKDGLGVTRNDEYVYMGEWSTPLLPNTVGRSNPWLPNRVFPSDHLALVCVLAVERENIAVQWN
ncbi:hypothetical protein Poli38472_001170 [Pythium oligandrum]|uniref:Fibronectin type-III domain-containing protein n=1 Tax=Pythium oligandrum TaxID=41045 RepID=A0A8K1FQ39_PYTOL|nr:hypothetical protein Poli38472_001170 [Pythium oligandrum]|eukprot:TMW69014.1 hypothetical protein Poli38472_001170 [Pythium oligandrum]